MILFFCSQVPFYTLPPEDEGAGGAKGAKAAEAMFVEGFGKEFDVEKGDAEVSKCLRFFLEPCKFQCVMGGCFLRGD